MREFEYKVSVIVPIYNSENYLEECLDSLITQTLEQKYIEILLIDDGSQDKSPRICRQYAGNFENIKVFTQKNSGCSAARNLGIRKAQGKYIMYLDSDDTLTPDTIKKVTDFFDCHYDEIDMVSYYDQYYKDNKPLDPHIRYKYMPKTGIYDLTKTIHALQVRLNICVKNQFENNILFDTNMTYQEDQKYCCQILKEKMKLGFCKEGQYNYNKNETSVVGTQTYAFYMFEQSTKYFEDMFAQFEKVPKYFQSLFIHDISWKLTQHALFPFHYAKEDFDNALKRIVKLLQKVDVETILNHPSTDKFHKYYFLELRSKNDVAVIAEQSEINVLYQKNTLYHTKSIELILSKFSIRNNKVFILAYVKSPIFNFIDSLPKVYAEVCTEKCTNVIPLEVHLSSDSYYKARVVTNKFWSFFFEDELGDIKSIRYFVEIDGFKYNTSYYFMPRTPFNQSLKRYEFVWNHIHVKFENNAFCFYHENDEKLKVISDKLDEISGDLKIITRRKLAKAMRSNRIWLYYDCKGVSYDNGYYQFMHDINKKDGVERYYISNNDFSLVEEYFPESLIEYVVQFGSEFHKKLVIACEKIITAFIEETNIYPFSGTERKYYTDLFQFEIIYLQHGILHAHLPWKYTPERTDSDKIVVSSYFEKDNFKSIYHFREKDLLPFGMPRFEHVNRDVKSMNRILFAPTWRLYLIGENKSTGEWIYIPQKFLKSNYYEKIQEFLNHPKLHEILEKSDLYLDFKLHPIFKKYQDCFELTSNRVCFAENGIKDEEYSIFITDFSSFVFDFAYLKKPIIYFVPDYEEFTSGMNQYRELDLPFEEAFGNLVLDAEQAINEIEKVIQNDSLPEEVFLQRMNNFYLPMENCCEKIYEELISE